MLNPLINILVRTSNRPNYFANCYKSIREQSYKHVRLIVGYDDEPTKQYLDAYEIDALIECKPTSNWSEISSEVFLPGYIEKPFPPNEYFNSLMQYAEPGYIIKLDDDNRFFSPDSLMKIVETIHTNRQMVIWRVQFPGYTIPNNEYFDKPPHCCQMDTGCFAFHTDYIKYAHWDGYMYADFRVAMCLYLHIPQKHYINDVLIALQGLPGNGERKDLSTLEPNNNEV